MGFSSEIGGEERIRSRDPVDMPSRVDRAFVDFLVARGADIGRNPAGVLGPATRTEALTIEGVIRTFRVWDFEDPDLGPVSYYRWEADR